MSDPQSAAGPLIHGIPLALWVTIAVSVISPIVTVLGVWRSNHNARKLQSEQLNHARDLQRLQLDHDADQRDRERTMSLRREVYVAAAAALVGMQATFGRASNITIGESEITGDFAKHQATIVKIHIVGTEATVAAVMQYTNLIGAAYLEMLTRRTPLLLRKAKIDIRSALMQQALDDQRRFNGMLEQCTLEGVSVPEKLHAIQVQFDYAGKVWKEQHAIYTAFLAEQLTAQFEVADRLMEINRQAVPLLPLAVLAIRNELELHLEPEWYKEQWRDQVRKIDQAWNEAKERLKAVAAE